MDLPTFLVILFLLNGDVYQEVYPMTSPEVCQVVVKNFKELIPKAYKVLPQYYSATCVKLIPFTKDA